MEPVVGLEPTTNGLQNHCSTTELNWLSHYIKLFLILFLEKYQISCNIRKVLYKIMSHISGEYIYSFVRTDAQWDNSAQTGISSLVVGMTCTFSGHDSQDVETVVSRYIDGTTGFDPYISYDYLNANVDTICNEYASGCDWFNNLMIQVSGSVDHPVPVTGWNPTGVVPVPPDDIQGAQII